MDQENTQLWQKVESDKFKYKIMLVVSLSAWIITMAVLAYIGYLYYLEYEILLRGYEVGIRTDVELYKAMMNVLYIGLAVSIIIAFLTSIIIIMRQRSSSLLDIQLRLALVEQHISEAK